MTHCPVYGLQRTLNLYWNLASWSFFTSQDYLSYTGDKKKVIRLATVTGRLSALLGYSFTDKDIIQSFGYLLVDLFARNYPK